jgi:hypothetical protein
VVEAPVVPPGKPAQVNDVKSRCNGTKNLEVKAVLVKNEVNEFKTHICNFNITIRNKHTLFPIAPVLHIYTASGRQNAHSDKWDTWATLEPGKSMETWGEIVDYTDPESTGSKMRVLDKYAGIFDRPECKSLMNDTTYAEEIGFPFDTHFCD